MKRINGYIDVDRMLGVEKQKIYDVKDMLAYLGSNNDTVTVQKKNANSQFVFSFKYHGTTYYFKFDSLVSPYNELIAYYIAKDFGLSPIKYDLATLGVYDGVISKDFKDKRAKYILGSEILKSVYGDVDLRKYNNLEDIWFALEDYFKDREDMQEIVSKIMNQLVRLFIFDMLLGQEDRHYDNWGIVEYLNGVIELQPVFDNSRILVDHPDMVNSQLLLEEKMLYMEDTVMNFLRNSSSEFSKILPDFLWVISNENIIRIFDLIEKQTKWPMPEDLKKEYLLKFQIYYNYFDEMIDEYKSAR